MIRSVQPTTETFPEFSTLSMAQMSGVASFVALMITMMTPVIMLLIVTTTMITLT